MQKLREVQQLVTEELKSNYSARTNDNELILGVMKRLGINTNVPFVELVRNRKLPSFESITRARRKVQADNPQLKDSETSDIRREREEVYREYSQEKM